ncbi:hypothetical protein EUGRSUZ_L01308 [Eucalyptus grandis]|uniref:Uncharacterized protein n=1 Tax=Eucalyptus grandis TaxID=71139 RepID=A0A058ZTH2_EUCGR|nr:hypothetical protein EUGRSUZ_L01308 [Eucalyptus grandis]
MDIIIELYIGSMLMIYLIKSIVSTIKDFFFFCVTTSSTNLSIDQFFFFSFLIFFLLSIGIKQMASFAFKYFHYNLDVSSVGE